MNSSQLIEQIYAYLGFHSVEKSARMDETVAQCLDEVKAVAHFRYIYKFFDTLPQFLKSPPYADYLKGNGGVFLAVMTLGGEIDAKIRFYNRTDTVKAVVFDACASAYLEYLSDEYEKTMGENLSYRFCPGYGGSDIGDIRYIFELVSPEKIGVTLTQSDYMLPSKSMAGVIAVGGGKVKSCAGCTLNAHCGYRKRGEKCYGSEK